MNSELRITDVKTFLVHDRERPDRNYAFVKVYTDQGLTGLRGVRHQRQGTGPGRPDRHLCADPAGDGPDPHRAHLADPVAGPVLPRRARAQCRGGRDRHAPCGPARQGPGRARVRPARGQDPRLRPLLLPRAAARRARPRRAGHDRGDGRHRARTGGRRVAVRPVHRGRRLLPSHRGLYEQEPALRWTVDAFAALRDALGPEIEICVDFHQRTTPAYAIQMANALAPMRPFFIEDPVRAENPDQFRLPAPAHLGAHRHRGADSPASGTGRR